MVSWLNFGGGGGFALDKARKLVGWSVVLSNSFELELTDSPPKISFYTFEKVLP